MANRNYDRSRGNTGRSSSFSGGSSNTARRSSGGGQAEKQKERAATAARKFALGNTPSAVSNAAIQTGINQNQAAQEAKADKWKSNAQSFTKFAGNTVFPGLGNVLEGPAGQLASTLSGADTGITSTMRDRQTMQQSGIGGGTNKMRQLSSDGIGGYGVDRGGQFGNAGVPEPDMSAQAGQLPPGQMQPGALQPWQQAGTSALGQQQALLGMGGQEAQQQAFSAFGDSPGQKFLRDRAEKVTMRNAPQMGGLGGGNVRSALNEQAVGFAAQDYGNYYNRLGGLSGQGYQATAAGLDQDYRNQRAASDDAFRNRLNDQQLSQMNQQQKAGQTEGILNLIGQFEEPIGNMFSGIGDSVSDWFGW